MSNEQEVQVTIQMGDVEYLRLEPDFTLDDAEKPATWSLGTPIREKPLETLLSVHFAKVFGFDSQLVSRAGDHWGAMDLVALDTLDRLHVVELKKGPCNKAAADQLAQYVLGNAFVGVPRFIDENWARQTDYEFQPGRLAQYIASVFAGVDGSTLSFADIVATLAIEHGKGWWRSLEESERRLYRIDTLCMKASRASALDITRQAVQDAAARVFASQFEHASRPAPRIDVSPACVLWLAGRSLTPDAQRQLVNWRGVGIDARFLQVDARLVPSVGLVLGVRREVAPNRDAIEYAARQKVAAVGPDAHGHARARRVRLSPYDASNPSARTSGTGALLDQPTASLSTLEEKRVEFVADDATGPDA